MIPFEALCPRGGVALGFPDAEPGHLACHCRDGLGAARVGDLGAVRLTRAFRGDPARDVRAALG
ncbi:MAG: hypothetical protein JWO90_1585 [Solirubrobacterales bacterium]|nr:hypothetical protein [Solirubrobacterales bacterium]